MEFQALQSIENSDGNFNRKITTLNTDDLPQNGVLIEVQWSALNYKDALSASGHKGISKNYPHTPGIDAAGKVVSSTDSNFKEGDEVIVTSYDLGMNTPGGFGGYINVPSEWVLPLPKGLTLRESMILGTAGFTAALALYKMEQSGQQPNMGEVLVTGASGGVGSMAVSILSQAGYQVVASSGKLHEYDYLKRLGASICVSRAEVSDESGKPLLKPRWAGAIDTVGNNTLATAIKACGRNGNIAVCGNVASPELTITVFPFILNGINLLGIESAHCPMDIRTQAWELLAGKWKPKHLDEIAQETDLAGLNIFIDKILNGEAKGRIIIRH